MKELDDVVKILQYRFMINNALHDEIRSAAYTEAVKIINETFKTDYEAEELSNLKFEDITSVIEFYKNLPLRKK